MSLLKIKNKNNNNNKLGFHTSIPSLVCHYLKSKRKGYNRNQNIKYTTWPYTKHLIHSYLDFQYSQLQSSQLTTCEKQKTQKHTILKGKQKNKNFMDLIWYSKWQVVGKQLVSLWQSWQTVGQCMTLMANSWAMLAESWAIFRNVGKQLGGLRQCWQTVWQCIC